MTNEEMTEHDLYVITSMLADLYALYLGHNLANETILSMLCMDNMSKISLNYEDTTFVISKKDCSLLFKLYMVIISFSVVFNKSML
jgi:hypothetical protein